MLSEIIKHLLFWWCWSVWPWTKVKVNTIIHSRDRGSQRVKCESYCLTGFWDKAGNGKTLSRTHAHTHARTHARTHTHTHTHTHTRSRLSLRKSLTTLQTKKRGTMIWHGCVDMMTSLFDPRPDGKTETWPGWHATQLEQQFENNVHAARLPAFSKKKKKKRSKHMYKRLNMSTVYLGKRT